jgi:hypothetical protein
MVITESGISHFDTVSGAGSSENRVTLHGTQLWRLKAAMYRLQWSDMPEMHGSVSRGKPL